MLTGQRRRGLLNAFVAWSNLQKTVAKLVASLGRYKLKRQTESRQQTVDDFRYLWQHHFGIRSKVDVTGLLTSTMVNASLHFPETGY